MKAFFLLVLSACSFCCSGFANSSVSDEKMAVYKLMMDQELIKSFVCHPKTYAYFLDQMVKYNDYLLSLKDDLISIIHQFPLDRDVLRRAKYYVWLLDTISDPSLSKECFLLISWGVADTLEIRHPDVLASLNDLQVKLFKNFLHLQGIGHKSYDEWSIAKKIQEECSHLKLYPKINLLVEQVRYQGDELNDIYFSYEDDENLSGDQLYELDKIFDPAVNRSYTHAYDNNKDDEEDDEEGDEIPPGYAALLELDKRYPSGLLSRDRLIQLFFEVIKEVYPEKEAYFSDIQNRAL